METSVLLEILRDQREELDDLNDVLKCLYQIYGDFTHLFLDEAQNVEGWHLFVNRLLRHGMKLIITGSNAKLLSSELSTYLTGRYNEIELFPFSFREFCEMEKVETTNLSTKTDALLRRAFDKYMETGGFPEIISGEETAEEYIDTLVSNILERDIVQRFKVRYKDAFKSLSHHLMQKIILDGGLNLWFIWRYAENMELDTMSIITKRSLTKLIS